MARKKRDVWSRNRRPIPAKKEFACPKLTVPKFIKCITCLVCLSGFCYQTSSFVGLYMARPVILDIKVHNLIDIEVPAMTICNVNSFRRRAFCARFPSGCMKIPELGLCLAHPYMCEDKRDSFYRMYPKLENALDSRYYPRDILEKLGHQAFPLIANCTIEMGKTSTCENNYIRYVQIKDIQDYLLNCFTINSRRNATEVYILPRMASMIIELDFEPEEYVSPSFPHEIIVSIHSSDQLISPSEEGFVVRPASMYDLHVQKERRILLPPPYSNCSDFNLWMQQDRGGDEVKLPCVEACKLRLTVKKCDCLDSSIFIYFTNLTRCKEGLRCLTDEDLYFCYEKCQNPCTIEQYRLHVRERKITKTGQETSNYRVRPSSSFLRLRMDNIAITDYMYTPQYQAVEAFGYVGGYVGIWLGISLITVYEYSELGMRLAFITYKRLGRRTTIKSQPQNSQVKITPVIY